MPDNQFGTWDLKLSLKVNTFGTVYGYWREERNTYSGVSGIYGLSIYKKINKFACTCTCLSLAPNVNYTVLGTQVKRPIQQQHDAIRLLLSRLYYSTNFQFISP